jgi:GAF domain-containing protein
VAEAAVSERADRLRDELERLRLENETLYGVVGLIGSSPDLPHVLARVVDLLSRATACHACFVYVLEDDTLVLRAASPMYLHVVDQVRFGVDEGLAGWAVRERRPAFIRENAFADPRFKHVPALEEERFQSMVAVPVPSRADVPLGVIILHTVAPREFDERVLNVLTHSASLVAGTIENAQLYEDTRRRAEALSRLSNLSQEIAAAETRDQLRAAATTGVRRLIECEACLFLESAPGGELEVTAADPGTAVASAAVVLAWAEADETEPLSATTEEGHGKWLAIPVTAGREQLGALAVRVARRDAALSVELLRSVAHQIALAIKRTELIERLTEENLARDLFDALEHAEEETFTALARSARLDLASEHVVVEVRATEAAQSPGEWSDVERDVERVLRRTAPGAVCDQAPSRLRAIVPVTDRSGEAARRLITRVGDAIGDRGVVAGASTPRRGAHALRAALSEAADAAAMAGAIGSGARAVCYADLGAYRYLVGLIESGGPQDHLRDAVARLRDYDRRRQSQLLETLETYLDEGRSTTATSRTLLIHVNTLRQRLQRIESLSKLDLASEDLLALHLAVKLGRLTSAVL